jgi:hypothetical protein
MALKSYGFQVTPAFLERLDSIVDKAKDSNFALSTPVNRSEIVRQAALIGFDVIDALGEDFAGHLLTQPMIQKKFNGNK